jgi:hypothetical protein
VNPRYQDINNSINIINSLTIFPSFSRKQTSIMQFSKLSTIALLGFFTSTNAYDMYLKGCSTTNGSPTVADINKVIDGLNGKHGCSQDNPFGTQCTTIQTNGGAHAGLCGYKWGWGNSKDMEIDCHIVANAAMYVSWNKLWGDGFTNGFNRLVINKCSGAGGRASGEVQVSNVLRVTIF